MGRAFNGEMKPKWLRYGSARYPYMVPHAGSVYEPLMQSKGVVVEDALSACAVSEVCDGIALMGTSIPDSYYEFLNRYEELTICLDKDASDKALKLSKNLQNRVRRVKFLERDLKYEKAEQIQELIK